MNSILRNPNVVGIFLVLFLVRLDAVLSAYIRDNDYYEPPPKSDIIRWINASKGQDYKSSYLWRRLKTTSERPLHAPVIQIQLLKGHVLSDDTWSFGTEYIYSPKEYEEYNSASKDRKNNGDESNGEENKNTNEQQNNNYGINNNSSTQYLPYIGSRNIIKAPTFCPKGEQKDPKGNCRPVVNPSSG